MQHLESLLDALTIAVLVIATVYVMHCRKHSRPSTYCCSRKTLRLSSKE